MEKENKTAEGFNLEEVNKQEVIQLGVSRDYFNNIPAFMLKNEGFVKEWIGEVARGEIKNYSEYFSGDAILELSNKGIVEQINLLVDELKKIAQEFTSIKDENKREEILENFKIKAQEIYDLKPRG